jgi:hypothetical protein
MPRVHLDADRFEEFTGKLNRERISRPTFLNSVPKCGTHLMKNIMRAFVPAEQHYNDTFIQIPILQRHLNAYNPNEPKLSWGHMLFSDQSAIALRDAYHILMIRDPYDWVLARTRFFLSDNFQGNMENLKSGQLSLEEIMNLMIWGVHQKAPPLKDIFELNGSAWIGTRARVIRLEDLLLQLNNLDSIEAERFFLELIRPMGHSKLPEDWQERVRLGSKPELSGTFRDNLSGIALEIPKELPSVQKRLVDHAAPGLRKLLGYE